MLRSELDTYVDYRRALSSCVVNQACIEVPGPYQPLAVLSALLRGKELSTPTKYSTGVALGAMYGYINLGLLTLSSTHRDQGAKS